MFTDPNMIAKLSANPKTAKYLADPTFINKVSSSTLFFFSVSLFSILPPIVYSVARSFFAP